ncbi:hypothetical protein EDD15DRAFT_2193222 [Pisolithus albus]|nr:hypothetical protein EDD15DRAFT_2193222 [Pisolithus albus]
MSHTLSYKEQRTVSGRGSGAVQMEQYEEEAAVARTRATFPIVDSRFCWRQIRRPSFALSRSGCTHSTMVEVIDADRVHKSKSPDGHRASFRDCWAVTPTAQGLVPWYITKLLYSFYAVCDAVWYFVCAGGMTTTWFWDEIYDSS